MARRALLVAQGAAVGLVVLLLALLVWKLVSNTGGNLARAANRGELPAAPNFTLDRLDRSGKLALSDLRGKAVAVNFWASWCQPCKQESPYLEQAWMQNRGKGFVVVGVDANDFRSDARGFMRRYGITYPVLYDGPGSTLGRYGVKGFPETYVVNRDGRVVDAFVGAIASADDRQRLREAVQEALQ
jgi:cytochrome c biogenesis protein CcmG, thiol:disulfide interchange protein DsbE